jgi:hypothetical protein
MSLSERAPGAEQTVLSTRVSRMPHSAGWGTAVLMEIKGFPSTAIGQGGRLWVTGYHPCTGDVALFANHHDLLFLAYNVP